MINQNKQDLKKFAFLVGVLTEYLTGQRLHSQFNRVQKGHIKRAGRFAGGLSSVGMAMANIQKLNKSPKFIKSAYDMVHYHDVSWYVAELFKSQGLLNGIGDWITSALFYLEPLSYYEKKSPHEILKLSDVALRIDDNKLRISFDQDCVPLSCDVFNALSDATVITPKKIKLNKLNLTLSRPSYYKESDQYAPMRTVLDNYVIQVLRACIVNATNIISDLADFQFEALPNSYSSCFSQISNVMPPEKKFNDKFIIEAIEKYEQGIQGDARSETQINDVEQFKGHTTVICSDQGGNGKTRKSLLWHCKESPDKQSMIVLPRNAPAKSTGKQVVLELDAILGQNHQISSETFLKGERIDKYSKNCADIPPFESNIVVTNIDNFLAPIQKHSMASKFLDVLSGTLILDEYHELVGDAPLFYCIMMILWGRHNVTKSKSLLPSATPLPLAKLIDPQGKIFQAPRPPSWNKTKVVFKFVDSFHDLPKKLKGKTFSVFNSSKETVCHFLRNGSHLRATGKYIDVDYEKMMDGLFDNFGKNPISKVIKQVSACEIIKASLDISAENVVIVINSPMGFIQVFARAGRFAEYDVVHVYVVNPQESSSEMGAIKNNFDRDLFLKWYETLKEFASRGTVFYQDDFYQLYDDFFQKYSKDVDEWIKRKLYNSLRACNEMPPVKKDFVSKDDILWTNSGNFRKATPAYWVTAGVMLMDNNGDVHPHNKDPNTFLAPNEIFQINQGYEIDEVKKYMTENRAALKKCIKKLNCLGFAYPSDYADKPDSWEKLARKSDTPFIYPFYIDPTGKDSTYTVFYVKHEDDKKLGLGLVKYEHVKDDLDL